MSFTILRGTALVAAALLVVGCQSTTRSKKSSTGGSARFEQTAAGESGKRSAAEASARRSGSIAIPREGMVAKAHAFPTGEKATSAVMLEKVVPTEVQANQSFDYYLRVTNLTDHNLENVIVSEQLPASFKIAGSEPQAKAEPGLARWMLGKLGANETRTIAVKGKAGDVGSIDTCASVDYASRVCTSINVVRASLQLVKKTPSEVLMCDDIPVEYIVTNTGTGTARNIVIGETLPSQLMTSTRAPVSFKLAELAPGKSRSFKTVLKATRTGVVESAANLEAAGSLKASSSKTRTIVRQPVLKITKSAPKKAYLGRDVRYTITVENVGDGIARGTRLEESLPAGVRIAKASAAHTLSRGNAVWNLGDLAPKAKRTIEVDLRAEKAQPLSTSAKVSARCTSVETATATTQLVGIPAILLEVIDVNDPLPVGETNTYEIRVTNQGSAPGTGIVITCTLEDSMEFVSATGVTRGSRDGATVLFQPLMSLAPKAAATWKVMVRAAKAADVRFRVSMQSDQIERPVDETEATNFYQ